MEPESKIGQCPRCLVRDNDKTEKKLFRCNLCGVWYCEKHVLPKPCYIVDLGKPDRDPIKWRYLNDDHLGHPDVKYTERQGLLKDSQPITSVEETKLPEPPVTVRKVEEKRTFGTCPKCRCTDSDIIKDYPHKAILKCWNCYLKYGQKKYPPHNYIRLRKRRPHSSPQSPKQQPITRNKVPITRTFRTANRKGNSSAKKALIAGIIIVSLLAIMFFYGTQSNFDSQKLVPSPIPSTDTSPISPHVTSPISLPATPPIAITGRVIGVASESSIGENVSGVQVSIINSKGNEVTTSITDSMGRFSFSNLLSGSYTIQITVPHGYVANSATSYSLSYSSDVEFKLQNLLVNPKTMHYQYTLRGVSSEIAFTVYQGMYDYLASMENSSVFSYVGQEPSSEEITRIVTLRYVNESTEKGELRNLVRAIQQITSNEDDQVRIAVSLVQNIPYGGGSNSYDWKYPYEILYSNMGICSEKSRLLVCLLQELGYGCSILEFPNHAAVGVACPSQYAYYSGYAFVESTTPTIITDCYGDYVGAGKLPSSPSYIIIIQDGKVMNSVSEEYQDCQTYRSLINMGPVLDESHYSQWQTLVSKYGIQVS